MIDLTIYLSPSLMTYCRMCFFEFLKSFERKKDDRKNTATNLQPSQKNGASSNRWKPHVYWSGRQDLNLRPLAPQPTWGQIISSQDRSNRLKIGCLGINHNVWIGMRRQNCNHLATNWSRLFPSRMLINVSWEKIKITYSDRKQTLIVLLGVLWHLWETHVT